MPATIIVSRSASGDKAVLNTRASIQVVGDEREDETITLSDGSVVRDLTDPPHHAIPVTNGLA